MCCAICVVVLAHDLAGGIYPGWKIQVPAGEINGKEFSLRKKEPSRPENDVVESDSVARIVDGFNDGISLAGDINRLERTAFLDETTQAIRIKEEACDFPGIVNSESTG